MRSGPQLVFTKPMQSRLQPLEALAPKNKVAEALCTHLKAPQSCTIQQGGNSLQRQNMFSFYVHSSMLNFSGFQPHDVFYGTMIQDLTHAIWGDTSTAVRNLMSTALKVLTSYLWLVLHLLCRHV